VGSYCLYACGFRFYFTPLSGVLFAFPSRYWFTIGRQRVFSLGGWSPHVQTRFHVPRPTQFHAVGFSYTGLSPAMAGLSRTVLLSFLHFWADPRSLATTSGISVDFFSSGYLDVSVLRVCFPCGILLRVGCPIRKPPDQSLFADSPTLSQATASFIACCRQGIHHMHLVT
jgi:hypothetical protein